MPTSRRSYEPPKLVQYGDLVTLTKGAIPSCPSGYQAAKVVGAGDDYSAMGLAASPWTCIPN